MLFLTAFTLQKRQNTCSVNLYHLSVMRHLLECRQHIPERTYKVRFVSSLDVPLPRHDEGDPYSSLVQVTLITAIYTIAIEEIRVTATLAMRTVVTCKYDYSIVVKSFLFELSDNLPHIDIKAINHSRKRSVWILL